MISTNLPSAVHRSRFILVGVSSKRIEARADPLWRGIGGGKQSFPIPQSRWPIHPFEGDGCSFCQRLMVSTQEALAFIYAGLPASGIKPLLIPPGPLTCRTPFNEPPGCVLVGRQLIMMPLER